MDVSQSISTPLRSADRLAERSQDNALIKRIQAGEIQLFDQLVHRYKARLFSVIYNLIGNQEDTADLLQDTFIKAFQAIGRFKAEASFFTWIYRIALNTTTSYLRRKKIRHFFSMSSVDEGQGNSELLEALTDTSHSADQASLNHELKERLNQAIQQLSLKHRTAIVLFEIEGLSHSEIARIANCSEGTVRSRVHYAKMTLQSLLAPYLT